jgi:hypothetical protein
METFQNVSEACYPHLILPSRDQIRASKVSSTGGLLISYVGNKCQGRIRIQSGKNHLGSRCVI